MRRATLKVSTETLLYFWGVDLTKAREELGLSQEEFAEKCDWSQQNQAKLEEPGVRHVLDPKKKASFKALGIRLKFK